MTRAAVLVLTAFGVACTLPLWLAPYPPLQDLAANTETACQLLRLWRDEPAFSSVLFVHPQPWANSLPAILLALLLAVSPSFAMTKLLLSAALVSWPLSIGWMLQRFGRSPWLALLCLPLAFDLSWSYGFLHFLLARPLVPLCIGLARARLWRGTALTLALVLAFFLHSLTWILASACALIVVVVFARRARDLLGAVPVALAALVSVPFFSATHDAGPRGVIAFRDPLQALAGFWGDLGDQRPGGLEAVSFLVALAVLLAVLWHQRAALFAISRERIALLACGAMLFVAWIIGPPVLPQVSVVSPRLLSLAVMLLVVGVCPVLLDARLRIAVVASMALAMGVHLADLTRGYRAFSATEMGEFDALLDQIPPGSRVATHYASPFSPHARHNALWHWGKLACLERAAFTDDLFAYRKTAYVEVKPAVAATFITPPHRLKRAALLRFDALLLRGHPRVTAGVSDLLEPLATAGSWHLFSIRPPQPPTGL